MTKWIEWQRSAVVLLAVSAGLFWVSTTSLNAQQAAEQTGSTLSASPQSSNPLEAKTDFSGPSLKFDFPSLRIGIAEYDQGPTGATVFYFPSGVFAAVDVRGGSPGTILTEGIRLGYDENHQPWVDAICFAGGSCYGLEAASGVMAELLTQSAAGNRWGNIAVVPGAIVYDFNNRQNMIYPDKKLGRAALRSASTGSFPLGARGAGRFVHVGGYFGGEFREQSGQGAAFRQIGDVKIAVFTVVNAIGAIVDRQGKVVLGNRNPQTGKRTLIDTDLRNGRRHGNLPQASDNAGPTENTTLTLVVTNMKLGFSELQRLAIYSHTSMARVIQPFHTPNDGDTLFAVTTHEVDKQGLSLIDLSTHSADLAWDAVLSCFPSSD